MYETRMDGSVAQLSQDELVRPVCSLRDELAGLRDENAVLREELAAVRSENAVLRDELAALQDENGRLQAENEKLRKRLGQLEGRHPATRLDEAYSVNSEERRRAGGKSGRSKTGRTKQSKPAGRKPTDEKLDNAQAAELCLPEGFSIGECRYIRDRVVWRIIDGKAVLVAYEIWHGPGGEKPVIDGVLPRSEFGIEILLAVAFQVSVVGLSIDKACAELAFFWELNLSKSQADSLLSQLANAWEDEFETLCELLAHSAVVHTDETSWSINSVWAYLSGDARVMIFGCRKDANTLAQILSKETFDGIVISDDAAVYQGFSRGQKCWAHLLRKAIRLTLLFPDNEEYRAFLDRLLAVFHKAKRAAADGRLGEAGRQARVATLFDELSQACLIRCGADFFDNNAVDEPRDESDREFFNLVQEVARLLWAGELFTFVLHPEADATNNEAERSLRGAALDRRTGRTSKTIRGARRRTILVSVLESLRLHLPKFHLGSVIEEVSRWLRTGESLFSAMLTRFGLDPPTESRLDKLVPLPETSPPPR